MQILGLVGTFGVEKHIRRQRRHLDEQFKMAEKTMMNIRKPSAKGVTEAHVKHSTATEDTMTPVN